METFISMIAPFFFGVLITITIRWVWLNYSAHKILSNQKGVFDRVIDITSGDILNGVIRKRKKQVRWVMENSDCYEHFFMEENPKKIPQASPDDIYLIYKSFEDKGLSVQIIPNEDIYIAHKNGQINNKSEYFLNDDLIIRLSTEELEEIEEKNQNKLKKIEEKNQKKLEKAKEQEIEDSINI